MDTAILEKEIALIAASHGCKLYGVADLTGLTSGELARFHRGIAFVFQMEPWEKDPFHSISRRTQLRNLHPGLSGRPKGASKKGLTHDMYNTHTIGG